jgi:hypothetical protein
LDHQKILKLSEDKNEELESDISKNLNSIRDLSKKLDNEKASFLITEKSQQLDNDRSKDKLESDCNIFKAKIKTFEEKIGNYEIACNQKDEKITQLTKTCSNFNQPKVNFFCF